MILADTSVWVEYLNRDREILGHLIFADEVLVHPFVIGELACGGLPNREQFMEDLHDMPRSPVASESDTLDFIERNRLMNTGLNYIDVHLLAAASAVKTPLWTFDRKLRTAALGLNLAADAFLEELDLQRGTAHPV